MEATRSANGSRMTRGRRKDEEKTEQEAKRRKTLFQPRKVIGPRDILVNRSLGKVSLGMDQDVKPVVKSEETGGGDDQVHSVDMQVTEMEHVVKVEAVESPENSEDESAVLEGTDGGIEKTLQQEIQLLKKETVSKNARIKALEGTVKELKARVTQLENRGEMELEALIDRKLRERGINLLPVPENTESSNLQSQDKVPMSLDEPEATPINSWERTGVSDAEKIVAQSHENNIKVTELFPEVAAIIWKKFGNTMLSFNDFLNARLVCTSWSQGIDKIPKGPCRVLYKKRRLFVRMCCLKHTSKVVRGREATGLLARTSLAVRLYQSCQYQSSVSNATLTECTRKLTELLKKQGSNVQEADFPNSIYTYCDPLNWYSTVLELVAVMPNLEGLSMEGMNHTAWSNFIDVQPFPKLSNLQHFGSVILPIPVMRAVLLSNNHINSLGISLLYEIEITGILKDVLLPHLKELRVYDLLYPRDLECLLDLRAPSLQVFKVYRAKFIDWEAIDSKIIYKVLEHFQATLVDLELNFIRPVLKRLPEMRTIKRLTIKFENSCSRNRNLNQCQQLVASMPGLEYLEFMENHQCRALVSPCLKETIAQQYKLLKTEFVSKLWDVLPKLHHVKVDLRHSSYAGPKNMYWDFLRTPN